MVVLDVDAVITDRVREALAVVAVADAGDTGQ
jgi:hypothetical protein